MLGNWAGVGRWTTNVAVGGHVNDFQGRAAALDPAMFVTAAEDVGLEFICRLFEAR